MDASFITVNNISKTFPGMEGRHRSLALHEVNLHIHKGEFLVLLGPSGCGKSTLLRIMAGLEKQTHGTIVFHEPFNLDKAGFVFQDFGLLPWLSVEDNTAIGLIGRGVPQAEREHRVREILDHFGLTAFKHHFPRELSGGMRQRVGLARAFVTNPEIIFLDEPFSELDFFTAESLRSLLLDLWKKQQATIVMVSHYIDEAVSLADRIVVFSDRPGTVKAIVKNDLARPRDYRATNFFTKEDEVLNHFK